jgi:hypothetical protein
MTSLLLAATTTGPNPGALVALAVLVFVGWRLLLRRWFPYAPCKHCKGSSKHWSGRFFRPCPRCKGTGRRIRFGRRVWNATGRS